MSINAVFISGNLTRDPELRALPTGTQVLSFGMAVNDRIKNQQTGQYEDRPNFIDCVMFGARAESLSHILAKGMKVTVQGKLRYSAWEKDGQKRSKLEVVADEVELPQRQQNQNMGENTYQNQTQPQNGPQLPTQAYIPAQPQVEYAPADLPF